MYFRPSKSLGHCTSLCMTLPFEGLMDFCFQFLVHYITRLMFIHIFTRGRLPRSVSSPSSCLMYVDSDKDLLCMRILAHAMWEEDCWAPGKLHLIPPKPVVTSFITPERTGGKRGTTVLLHYWSRRYIYKGATSPRLFEILNLSKTLSYRYMLDSSNAQCKGLDDWRCHLALLCLVYYY